MLCGYPFVQDMRKALGISTFDDDEGEKDKKAIVSRIVVSKIFLKSSPHSVLST